MGPVLQVSDWSVNPEKRPLFWIQKAGSRFAGVSAFFPRARGLELGGAEGTEVSQGWRAPAGAVDDVDDAGGDPGSAERAPGRAQRASPG